MVPHKSFNAHDDTVVAPRRSDAPRCTLRPAKGTARWWSCFWRQVPGRGPPTRSAPRRCIGPRTQGTRTSWGSCARRAQTQRPPPRQVAPPARGQRHPVPSHAYPLLLPDVHRSLPPTPLAEYGRRCRLPKSQIRSTPLHLAAKKGHEGTCPRLSPPPPPSPPLPSSCVLILRLCGLLIPALAAADSAERLLQHGSNIMAANQDRSGRAPDARLLLFFQIPPPAQIPPPPPPHHKATHERTHSCTAAFCVISPQTPTASDCSYLCRRLPIHLAARYGHSDVLVVSRPPPPSLAAIPRPFGSLLC